MAIVSQFLLRVALPYGAMAGFCVAMAMRSDCGASAECDLREVAGAYEGSSSEPPLIGVETRNVTPGVREFRARIEESVPEARGRVSHDLPPLPTRLHRGGALRRQMCPPATLAIDLANDPSDDDISDDPNDDDDPWDDLNADSHVYTPLLIGLVDTGVYQVPTKSVSDTSACLTSASFPTQQHLRC